MKIPCLGKFGPKYQNYQFKLKFGTYTNSNMQNSMVMFIFFVFDRKYPFWANLVQKVKIISWSWNLVARLIWICWIQWCCSLFSFLTGSALLGQIWSKLSIFTVFFVSDQKCPFLGKFGPKCQNCQFKAKFVKVASLIRICRIQRWCSLFSFSIGDALFWANLVKNAKMISLSWNFVDTYCFG